MAGEIRGCKVISGEGRGPWSTGYSIHCTAIIQARAAFDSKNYQKAEAFLLRAERADLAAKFYKVCPSLSPTPFTPSGHTPRMWTCGLMRFAL